MLPVLAALRVVPLWVYPCVAIAVWGGYSKVQAHLAVKKLQQQTAQLAEEKQLAEADARLKERALNKLNTGISDELAKTKQEQQRAAGTAAQRLRNLHTAWAASAASAGTAAACRDTGAPLAGYIPEQDREDLVALAVEADRNALNLRSCQRWATEVQEVLK